MPPKPTVVAVRPATLDFESRVDEMAKLMRSFVELKSGFGEAHVKSRTLQNIIKQFDIDHTGVLSLDEFCRTLDHMNIGGTADEREALFNRFDVTETGQIAFKDLSDAVFGLIPAPHGHPELRSIMKKFKDKMLQRAGDEGVRGCVRSFVLMDRNHDDALSKEEIFNGLQRYGVQCTLAEIDTLIKHLDRDGKSTVDLKEFLRALRGHMPRCRQDLVDLAFKLLDDSCDGRVTLNELGSKYDVSRHPAVINGTKTKDQVLRDFVSHWFTQSKDGVITKAEFDDYYKDISAAIENNEYFELMMRNCWHISGGEGAAQNTTCRRVLVTYRDGKQTIEEIKNDLGIGPKDLDKMKAALERQGLRDIVRIELYGTA